MKQRTPRKTLQSVKDWLEFADADYVSARMLFLSGTPFVWFPAAVLAQQALEKFFKAELLSYGNRVAPQGAWGHDLEKLANQCTKASVKADHTRAVFFSADFYRDLKKFNDYFEELRYPTKMEDFEELGREEFDLLDNLVSVVRPLIRFEVENIPSRFGDLYSESSAISAAFVRAARKQNRFWGKF